MEYLSADSLKTLIYTFAVPANYVENGKHCHSSAYLLFNCYLV